MTTSWGLDVARSLPRGSTLYTILRHVSVSRMRRYLDVVAIVGTRVQPILLPQVSCYDMRRAEYLHTGCGTDAGRDLVATIGQAVHGDPDYFRQDWL